MCSFKQLETVLRSNLNVSPELLEAFMDLAQFRKVRKGELLFRAGKPVTKLLFLEAGFLRAFRNREGVEYTHFFCTQNWFVTDYKAYLSQQPGALFIEALTDSEVLEFRRRDLSRFFSAHPEFEKLGRIIAEKAYLQMVERLVDFQIHSLKERYMQLIERNPQLFREVPQRFIATYLGVTEQSLSRIKSQIN